MQSKIILFTLGLIIFCLAFLFGYSFPKTNSLNQKSLQKQEIVTTKFTPPIELNNPSIQTLSLIYSADVKIKKIHVEKNSTYLLLSDLNNNELGKFLLTKNVFVNKISEKTINPSKLSELKEEQSIQVNILYEMDNDHITRSYISYILIK